MKAFTVLLLCFYTTSAAIHSFKYIETTSTGLSEFPEFVAVHILDDEVMGYFDSNINIFVNKQSWMEKLGQQNVERQTDRARGNVHINKFNLGEGMKRFNQSDGVHIVQMLCGCEWDDETGDTDGIWQHGYDGEDFLSYDLKTESWVAPKPQAFITKLKWEQNAALMAQQKYYLTIICIESLKKDVTYGNKTVQRTELPSVSFLQKTPSSPVRCHATGFYPDRVIIFWAKDGEELSDNVDHGELLPNHDGTFQISADLNVSSVKHEDWKHYNCVVQLYGVKEDIQTRLDPNLIRTNQKKPADEGGSSSGTIIAVVVVGLIVVIVGVVVGLLLRKRFTKPQPEFTPTNSDEDCGDASDTAMKT